MDYTGCRPFTDNEIELLLANCGERYMCRNRLLILLGVYTGFRIQELLSIRITDVWDGVKPRSSVSVDKGFMKNRARARTMPLHARVREAIQNWMDEQPLSYATNTTRPLFTRQRTEHQLCRRQADRLIRNLTNRAGVDLHRVATHSLRKAFARKMWSNPIVDKDMAKMARLLGHSNFSNTLKYLEFGSELHEAVLQAA